MRSNATSEAEAKDLVAKDKIKMVKYPDERRESVKHFSKEAPQNRDFVLRSLYGSMQNHTLCMRKSRKSSAKGETPIQAEALRPLLQAVGGF